MTEFWFGDTIENTSASESNPRRVGFFVRRGYENSRMNLGPYVVMTNGEGDFWRVRPDSLRLLVDSHRRLFNAGGTVPAGNYGLMGEKKL